MLFQKILSIFPVQTIVRMFTSDLSIPPERNNITLDWNTPARHGFPKAAIPLPFPGVELVNKNIRCILKPMFQLDVCYSTSPQVLCSRLYAGQFPAFIDHFHGLIKRCTIWPWG
jgi:hypothetical protein